jgi:phosphoribosylformylglycinamidine cyclo-ligase
VALDRIVTGEEIVPGDAVIGVPSNGLHSNGYTLARRALPQLEEAPPQLDGRTIGDELLRPTAIYVRAALELLRSSAVEVHGLAHITGDGFLNLPRLSESVGWAIEQPLPVPAVFDLIAQRADVPPEEMWETFNMGCGFCCVVPAEQAGIAVGVFERHHPGSSRIGTVTANAGLVELPQAGLSGRRGEGFRRA